MNEFSAALGLLQLKHVDEAIARRARDRPPLPRALGRDSRHRCPERRRWTANYAYFPVLVDPEYPLSRDALYQQLREHGIHARRYFYPLISDFPMYRGLPSAARENLPEATRLSAQVLCLPIYPMLTEVDQLRVIDLVMGAA